jgi:hypothetical protein
MLERKKWSANIDPRAFLHGQMLEPASERRGDVNEFTF